MKPGEFDGQAVRQQLERVLSSAGFSRNERLSRFLRLVVERHLEGRDSELKESLIAIEVFGRRPDYDPKQDSIVRTEAGRLRARLAEYYAGEGSTDPVVIELPKGGYTPVFRQLETAREAPKIPSRRQGPKVALALLLAVLAAVAGWWWARPHKSEPMAIGVLPLENLGGDPSNDYFADGLTDEIIRNLSVIEGLAVRSRTSSFALKGKPRNAREVGRQLEAQYILEGSVLRAGQRLRVNTQLVRVRDDFPLWSGRFDREVTDVFAIQEEIANSIANALRLKLGAGPRRYTDNLEAYQLYLRGRYALNHALPSGSEALPYFEQAIAKDANYAPAYAGAADALLEMEVFFELPHSEAQTRAKAAAEKAIELDPMLSEGHTALAMVHAREYAWQEAERTFRRAIELNPNNALAHLELGASVLVPLGRFDEGLGEIRRSLALDPLSGFKSAQLAYMLVSAGRYQEAAEQARKAIVLSPTAPPPYGFLGRALYLQGRNAEALAAMQEGDRRSPAGRGTQWLACAYVRTGQRDEALRILQENLARELSARNRRLSMIYACLGDKDRAFEYLEKMYAERDPLLPLYLLYPELAWMRPDPRFAALRQKVGVGP